MAQWLTGAVVPLQGLPRSASVLAGVPSAADIALGATGLFYDPAQVVATGTPRVYYGVSTDGQHYIAGGGGAGGVGPAGPANVLSIGTVTTLAAGSQATAAVGGTSPNQHLDLGIPTGPTGPAGPAINKVPLTGPHTLSSADDNTVFSIGVAGVVITVPGSLSPNEPFIGIRWTNAAGSVIFHPTGGAKVNGATADVTASATSNPSGLDLGAQLANEYWIGGDGVGTGDVAYDTAQKAKTPTGAVAVLSDGTMQAPAASGLTPKQLAGRPAPPGRLVLLIGGSETARASNVLTTPNTGVTGDGTTLTVTTQQAHLLHDGAEVFIAAEDANAPSLNGGVITFDNMFAYGTITVIDATHFSLPYWSANAGTPYATLTGTSTISFDVFTQQLYSPNGKFQEMQRHLGHPYSLVMNIATGSNNTAHMTERIPAVVSLVKAGLVNSVRGTFGIGNTIAYGSNHSLTIAQIVAQITSDLQKFWTALAPYGVDLEIEAMIAQADATGTSIGAQLQVAELLRKLSVGSGDPGRRVTMMDDFNMSYDITTGRFIQVYQINLSNNVHPSAVGCESFGYDHAKRQAVKDPFLSRITDNPLDNFKSDTTSGLPLQFFDPLISTTPLNLASTMDGRSSGNVPDLVTGITTSGNASRTAVFSYVQIHGRWYIRALLTAFAAGDLFNIKLTNKSGTRQLFNIINAAGGHKFLCMANFAFIPLNPDAQSWTSIETYFAATMSYRSISNRQAYLAADSLNYGAFKDGPMTSSRRGPVQMKTFTIPTGSTCTDASLNFQATAAAAGQAVLLIGAPTLRDVT